MYRKCLNRCCQVVFLVCLVAGSLQAQIIVEVGGSAADPPTILADTPEDHSFRFAGNTLASNDFSFTNGVGSATINVVDPTIGTFEFDITIALTTGIQSVDLDVNAGNNIFLSAGTAPDAANEFADDDIFTITVGNVTNGVVFDGFTNIGTADSANGEGLIVGGVSYIRGAATNGDNDPRNGVVFTGGTQLGPALTVESVGTTALRGVALQFSSSGGPGPGLGDATPIDPIAGPNWVIDDSEEWAEAIDQGNSAFTTADGFATSIGNNGVFQSRVQLFTQMQTFQELVIRQNKQWTINKWGNPSQVDPSIYNNDDVGPELGNDGDIDAAVFLLVQDGDYWVFDRQNGGGRSYHAYHSTDMQNWVDKGIIGAGFDWVTTSEFHDGKIFIYTDRPNDHDPSLLTIDYVAGSGQVFDSNGNEITGTSISTINSNRIAVTDHGVILAKPEVTVDGTTFSLAGGSDNCVFRDPDDGQFHIIHENWSHQNASRFSFDSNIASHAISPDGINGFVFDEATRPIDLPGNFITQNQATDSASFTQRNGNVQTVDLNGILYHVGDHPNRLHLFRLTDQLHAWGDYSMIKVGQTYYLFADDDDESGIGLSYWYGESLNEGFTYGGRLLNGLHPDPGVGFAEGNFLLILQENNGGTYGNDLISNGPWVRGVEAQAGVDVDGDGEIDQWSNWQEVTESYYQIDGFSKAFGINEAQLDTSTLPDGYGVAFRLRSASGGVLFDNVTISSTMAVNLGDVNLDGDVDCDDLDAYVGNLGMAATGALAPLDFDGDGLLSLADANSVITTLVMTSNGSVGTFPGDLNCDGTVNVLGEAFILIGNLGNAVSSYSEGDVNFDGTVNVLGDAFILIGNLGLSNNP